MGSYRSNLLLIAGSLYNAYPDYLLDLQLFPERLHDIQDAWYYIKTGFATLVEYLANLTEKYGLPLDSRHTYTKSDWEMFIAAISSSKTRNRLFDRLARWINETSTGTPISLSPLTKIVHLQIYTTPLTREGIPELRLSIARLLGDILLCWPSIRRGS